MKLNLLEAVVPAEHAIVFGDVWGVHGAYSQHLVDLGCDPVWVVDTAETPEFKRRREQHPALHFEQGDFSDPFYMKGLRPVPEVGIAFDILLHQGPVVNATHLILHHSQRAICIAQPMLKEQALPNALIYLPGNTEARSLRPSYGGLRPEETDDVRAFDVEHVNQESWLWGMTRSLMENLLLGEGFEITHEEKRRELENPNWYLWGCIAERRRANPRHWSSSHPYPTRAPG